MPRNKKNPREYVQEPHKRGNEKIKELLNWLIQFHHSTRKIILKRLELNTNSHHRYFKKLVDQGILQKVRVYSINERFIYMLSNLGKELAAENCNEAIQYNTDKTKINHAELRHSLAIQNAVLIYGDNLTKFRSEKFLDRNTFSHKKRPDAALIKNNLLTMLEIELTPKKDDRIFRALVAHAESLISNKYNKVLYIFPNKTLKEYYLKRFNLEKWPKFIKDSKNKWKKESDFYPNKHNLLREKFEFFKEERIIKDL